MGLDRSNVIKRIIKEPKVVEAEVLGITEEDLVKAVQEIEEVKIEEVKKEEIVEEEIELVECIEGAKMVITEEKLMSEESIEIEDERVICINTGEIYIDNKEASEQTGINASSIKKCCNGNAKSAGKDENGEKLVWKYLKDL